MKTLFTGLVLLIGLNATAQSYQLITDESTVEWTGEKIVGNSHLGSIDFSEGTLEVQEGKIVGGIFVIDMTTIEESNDTKKLEGHLKSKDFFGVEDYPTATLSIKSSKKGGNGELIVVADLTIKETTEEITFNTKLNENGGTITASTQLSFDRSKFDIRYGSNSFFDNLADKAISDFIKLNINIKASK